jgi:hypothetical protein
VTAIRLDELFVVIEKTCPLETVTCVEDDWRQNDVEKYLGIECRFEVDFVQISTQLASERVGVGFVLSCIGVV